MKKFLILLILVVLPSSAYADLNATESTYIDLTENGTNLEIAFDATEVDSVTWSAGADDSIIWTFDMATTDVVLTLGSASVDIGAAAFSAGTITGTGFTIGSAAIVESELEMIDGITAGTGAVNKALVLDAGSDITAGVDSFTANTFVGNLTGNADTATALSSNPAAATAGYCITDIAADGSVEGEVDVWTEAENTAAGYTSNTGDIESVGDCTSGACAAGIADNNIVQIDDADAADNDYAKFTATGIEGRSYVEVLSDIGAEPALTDKASLEATISDVTDFAEADGDIYTGTHDFGDADLEFPNTAGDVSPDTPGEAEVDTSQHQLCIYTDREYVVPLKHLLQGSIGTGIYDTDSDVWILDLDPSVYPDGIVITAWYVDCNESDPATELDANLMYCDNVGTGAFPGANPTLIDVIDTTTGNSSETDMSNSDLTNGIIPASKTIYIDIDADPVSDTTLFHFKMAYYIPES